MQPMNRISQPCKLCFALISFALILTVSAACEQDADDVAAIPAPKITDSVEPNEALAAVEENTVPENSRSSAAKQLEDVFDVDRPQRWNPYEDDQQEAAVVVSLTELPEALLHASGGETIRVKSGRYVDVQIELKYNGHGTVAVRAEQPGSVTITGESMITIQDSEHLILSGFMFDEIKSENTIVLSGSRDIHITDNYFYRNGIRPASKIIAIRNGSAYNHIHHNTFDDNKGQGVAIYNGHTPEDIHNKYNEIYNNYFYLVRPVSEVYEGSSNGLESVQIGQGKYVFNKFFTKVYENLFERNTGDRAEIISVKSSNNEVYRNTFLNNDSGLTIRLGDSNKIYSNYFKNTMKGLRTYGFDQLIYGNYFEGGITGLQLPAADTTTKAETDNPAPYYQTDRIKVMNNVFVNPGTQAFLFGNSFNRSRMYVLLPKDSLYQGNEIYITNDRAKDFNKDPAAFAYFHSLEGIRQNTAYITSDHNKGNMNIEDESAVRYVYAENHDIPKPEQILGFTPFESNDERVGASWKRPEMID